MRLLDAESPLKTKNNGKRDANHAKTDQHLLTAKLKEIRCARAQKLLESYGSGAYHDILFTDEKIFDIGAAFDKQNDRVYERSSVEAIEKVLCVQHGHHPAHKTVWLGVNW